MITQEQFRGCLLGLAFGDAMGAKYEGGFLERFLWRLIGFKSKRMRYTDETQMSLDTIRSILEHGTLNQDHLASQFASSYRWSRGYGPGAAKTLKMIHKGMPWSVANTANFKDGSYGNGAAMRAPVLAFFYKGEDLKEKVKQASVITHAHPEAIEGAYLIAMATSMSIQKSPLEDIILNLNQASHLPIFQEKLQKLGSFILAEKPASLGFSQMFGNGIEAKNSCVTAIAYALWFREIKYVEMFEAIKQGHGDVDTIAAMAGSIWGAYRGYAAMSELKTESLEDFKPIMQFTDQSYKFSNSPPSINVCA